MILNLSQTKDVAKFNEYSEKLLTGLKKVELKEIKETRSSRQNRALHLYFTMITQELNDLGMEFNYTGVNVGDLSTRYTPDIVKEFFWKPIQWTLFGIKSTTKIDTTQINEIVDVITKFFGEKGVYIEFPSIESLMNKGN